MFKHFLTSILVIQGMFSILHAFPAVVSDPIPCIRDLENHFFDEKIVFQALSLYNIRQELWVPIINQLRQKSVTIPERMKLRTAFMTPNPIEFPVDRLKTAKILKIVLSEVFIETLRFFQANERPNADMAFEYIFSEQIPELIRCFGEEVTQLLPESNYSKGRGSKF
jgi:hypothetical protein